MRRAPKKATRGRRRARRRLPRGLPEVEYRDGLHLKGSILWLDAPRARELAFISHAHVPGIAPHRKILTTEITRDLLTAGNPRIGAKLRAAQVLTCPYGRRFALGALDVELLPAGHVLGSAQLWVRNAEGRTLLYAGSICLDRRATCELAEVRRADVLVLDNTFGAPRFVFPPTTEIAVALIRWARETIESGCNPVLLAPTLGTAQEVAHLCTEGGLSVWAHPAIHRYAKTYADFGVSVPMRRLGASLPSEAVVVLPYDARQALDHSRWKHARRALVSGWATLEEVVVRARVHAAFALADSAGYADLLRYVEVVSPSVVYLTRPPDPTFTDALRERGVEVRTVTPPVQLDLFGES